MLNKKAMTYLEVVLSLIIISIIASISYPKYDDDNLQVAADELIANMKYASYLALLQDNFDVSDIDYKAKLWQIRFSKKIYGEKVVAYTIFKDTNGNSKIDIGKKVRDEFLIDKLSRKAIGAKVFRSKGVNRKKALKSTFLNKMYGVDEVSISKNCTKGNSQKLMFGHNGQIYIRYDKPQDMIKYDENNVYANQNTAQKTKLYPASGDTCIITLKQNDKKVEICIEVKTSYIYKCPL
jgi:Tfp pilus assembly protein FimT